MILLWLDITSSYAHSSLALPALHAQTLQSNKEWQWHVVSGTLETPLSHYVEKAVEVQPDVVAATAWLFTHNRLLEVLSRLKALLSNTYTILGGPEFLGDNEDYLRAHPYINTVFRGEGEEVFPKWLRHFKERKIRDNLQGICTIDTQNLYHDKGMAKVIRFDLLLPPEVSSFFPYSKPFVQIETTRGCFNDCYFCISGGDKPIRSHSVEHIKGRLQQLVTRGVKEIRVLDRTFNTNPKRTSALLHLFEGFSGLLCFHIEVHPALLTDEIIDILHNLPIGLLHIEAGVQSLDNNVLVSSGRVGNSQKAIDGVVLLKKCNRFEIHADLIAGLPNYSIQRIKEDVKRLISIGLDEVQLELLKVLPGTLMRQKSASLGIQYAPTPPYEVLSTPAMPPHALHQAQQLSRLLDGWYNKGAAWREPFVQLTLGEPSFLDDFLQYLMQQYLLEKPLSAERRGLLLYDFCRKRYPDYLHQVSVAWITAGYSLRKAPGQCATPYQQRQHTYPTVRFYHLPTPSGGYWFGFDRGKERRAPCIILQKAPE